MTLPRQAAQELIDHVSNCTRCKLKKNCPERRVLIRKTLEERHENMEEK